MPRKKTQNEIAQATLFEELDADETPENSIYQEIMESDDWKDCIVCCRTKGLLFQHDSLSWLKSVKSNCADVVFADPPYNIGKAIWDKFKSQDDYIEWSIEWIAEAARILKPHGTLFICGFTEILADLKRPAMKHFQSCKWLIWYYKNKANFGNDWGRSHESVLLLRKSNDYVMNIDSVRIPYSKHTLKYPSHPQAETSQYSKPNTHRMEWQPNPLGAKPKDVIEIPTTCNGMEEKTAHPTQKPEELLRRIVLSSSNENDVIVDPFCGSGTTIVVAEQLGRKWVGCEINEEYNKWAVKRINHVIHKSEEEWIAFDKGNAIRRESIR